MKGAEVKHYPVYMKYLDRKYPRHEVLVYDLDRDPDGDQFQLHTEACMPCYFGLELFALGTLDSQLMVGY